MRRLLLLASVGVIAAVGVYIGLATMLRADDKPMVGTWKVKAQGNWLVRAFDPSKEVTLWLVRIEEKDGKPQATLLATGLEDLKESKLKAFDVDDKSIRLTFSLGNNELPIVAHLPAGEAAPKTLLGAIDLGGSRQMIQLERTDQKSLDPKKSIHVGAPQEALKKALDARTDKEQEAALRGVISKYPEHPVAYFAALQLLELLAENGAEADVRTQVDQALKRTAPYGKEMELQTMLQAASILRDSEKLGLLGAEYARKAEGAVLAAKPAAVRKKDAGGPVLVEFFTGTQCPPCIAADFAFDGLLKTYKPNDVILLQYHVHMPGPDPLSNLDTDKRSGYYELDSAPTMYINGKEAPALGGRLIHGPDRYLKLRQAVDPLLDAEPKARIKLTATRKGDQLDLLAETETLKAGKDARLLFVLAEDVVKYQAPNGQRFHHHVVRALPGGVDGFALKEKSSKHSASVNLGDLRKGLNDYLNDYQKKESEFPTKERPLDLKNLKVVALVQDKESKEVLQATQVDVPDAGERPKE